jgi:predicted membrane channel-forming protein YqfA (hemolysin III family)
MTFSISIAIRVISRRLCHSSIFALIAPTIASLSVIYIHIRCGEYVYNMYMYVCIFGEYVCIFCPLLRAFANIRETR